MKSILAIFLCLCFLLCGCDLYSDVNSTEALTTSQATDSVLDTTEVDAIPYTEPLIAVAIPMVQEKTLAEDGNCIFTYSYQDFVLTMDDPLVAESITDDFLVRTDVSSSAQPVLDAAKAAYAAQADWTPYSCTVVYDPMRLDQSILSFYGSEIIDNGGPRSTSNNISVTYDLINGKALTLNEILVAGYAAEDLVSKILASISDLGQQGILFTDYEYIISDLFSTNTPMERWYFSQNGLCFFFTPYEIAPYNAGTVIAEVPYSELIGLLKDEYFPAEEVDFEGSLSLQNDGDIDMDSYSRFTEVTLDSKGTEHLIAPNGTVLNVRLVLGASENSLIPAYTVYAATGLTDGDAVVIQLTDQQKDALQLNYD